MGMRLNRYGQDGNGSPGSGFQPLQNGYFKFGLGANSVVR